MMTVGFSDHALLRYLERVHGFNIDAIRSAAEAEIAPLVSSLPTQAVVKNGIRYVIREGVVTTCIFDGDPWRGAHTETPDEKAKRQEALRRLSQECVHNAHQANKRKRRK